MSEADSNVRLNPPRPRRRWLRVLALLVIFCAGMVVGSAMTVIVGVRAVRNVIQHPEQAPPLVANRLKKRLGLSDAQASQVRQIVAERQAALQEVRRRVRPEVDSELERAHQQISEVLNPDQSARWDRMFEEFRRTWLPPPAVHN
jgi:hypothetical protein